jgi:hypothetical protein
MLMLVVFVSGVGVGAGGALLIVRNMVVRLIQHPEVALPEMAARIGSKLNLTPDQVHRVEQILLARQKSIEAIRSEVRPRLLQELDRLEQEVADALDPAQRQEWHDLCAHLRQTWLPPAPAPRPRD